MDPPFVLTREEYDAIVDSDSLLEMINMHFAHATDLEQFVGVAEVAEMLGVPKSAVSQRGVTLPEPIARTSSGPIWLRRELVPVRERLERRRAERGAS